MSRRVTIVLKTAVGGLWIVPQIHALRAADAEVSIVIPSGEGRLSDAVDRLSDQDIGIKVIRTSYTFGFAPSPGNITRFLGFVRSLRSLDADTYLYHLYASALATRFALIGKHARRVHMVAGPLYLESAIIRFAERILQRLDDVIICGSEDTRNRYRMLGVAEDRLITVPYGVDTAIFRRGAGDSRQVARAGLEIPPGSFVAVMVAFVYPPKQLTHNGRGIKGHAELLSAWSTFVGGRDDSILLIVGGGFGEKGEQYREKLVRDLPQSLEKTRVVWLDTVSDVRSAYAAADVSVSPSLSENHGAALEASSMSVPCIVSDAGGLPETVDMGASGWIVPAGDASSLTGALEEAYEAWQRGELEGMGSIARKKMVRSFDSGDAAQQVAQVVLDIDAQ